jgi:hypothetical protein
MLPPPGDSASLTHSGNAAAAACLAIVALLGAKLASLLQARIKSPGTR